MKKAVKFKQGQEVIIKNPGVLVGTVVKVRSTENDLSEDQELYQVRIDEQRIYRAANLAPAVEPSDKLKPYSKEWLEELNRWTDAAKRLVTDQNDDAALAEFSEAGSRRGWIVPIK